ncbi:3-deoxy-D-manno-octulosonic acid transferase [Desulfoglaeba alkanexedens]|uniref:3-deoxy-D-manno-octulosonic acid transferase n=1 Tax=Desulfoglaeba alkanexedens TaxID=361111 RepID=UPI0014774EEF|nr:glycosyltransferase N-terminal domain-containing protein [Desulfoglaeba alkanexedens]
MSRTASMDGRFRRGRWGRYLERTPGTGCPRIWFHAASVGEVTGAMAPLLAVKEKNPDARLFLSVGTPQGFRFAAAGLGRAATVIPAPLDLPWVVKRALDWVSPDVYVVFESEFWPILFGVLRRRSIPSLLLNGRISRRSARNYRSLGVLFRPIFRQLSVLAMKTDEDREHAVAAGAPPERVQVLGSAKYDALLYRTRAADLEKWRRLLRIPDGSPVVVGGSLRGSECLVLLEIFARMRALRPDLVGVFVPRHLENVPRMAKWLSDRRQRFHKLSDLEAAGSRREAPVVLVDRIGVLLNLYAFGDLIFCGGTLEPVGGHNIVEPAAWGKPVFYGPHVEKVQTEHQVLAAHGAGIQVSDAGELEARWMHFLDHPDALQAKGAGARAAVGKLAGVAEAQAALILEVLKRRAAG